MNKVHLVLPHGYLSTTLEDETMEVERLAAGQKVQVNPVSILACCTFSIRPELHLAELVHLMAILEVWAARDLSSRGLKFVPCPPLDCEKDWGLRHIYRMTELRPWLVRAHLTSVSFQSNNF